MQQGMTVSKAGTEALAAGGDGDGEHVHPHGQGLAGGREHFGKKYGKTWVKRPGFCPFSRTKIR
jgi:hypothetical protein